METIEWSAQHHWQKEIKRIRTARFGGLRRIQFLGFLILGLVAGCDERPETIIEMAEGRWKQGDYLGAIQHYRRVLDSHSKSDAVDDAYFAIGTIEALDLQDYGNAVITYRNLLRDFPDSPYRLRAQEAIADIYDQKLDDPRTAITEYQKLIEMAKHTTLTEEIRYKIGEAYVRLNDLEQARIEWGMLMEESPNSLWSDNALYRTGTTYFLEKDYEQAMAAYRHMLDTYPDSDFGPEAKFGIANGLEETGRLEEALEKYREIQTTYPNPNVIDVKIKHLDKNR